MVNLNKYILSNSTFTIFSFVIRFLFQIYIANNYPKNDLSMYFAVLDSVMIIVFIFSGFKDQTIRILAGKDLFTFKQISIAYFCLLLFILMVVFAGGSKTTNYLKISTFDFSMMILIACISQFIVIVVNGIKLFMNLTTYEFVKTNLFVISFFLLSLFFFEKSVFIILVYSFILSNLFQISINLFFIIKKIKTIKTKRILTHSKSIKNISISSMEYFSAAIPMYFSSVLASNIFGNHLAGDFIVVGKPLFLALITIASYPIFRFFFPYFLTLNTDKKLDVFQKKRKMIVKLVLVIFVIYATVFFFFGEQVLKILFTDNYSGAYYHLIILSGALPFIIITSYYFAFLKSINYFTSTLKIRIIGSIIFISSFFVLVNIYFAPIVLSISISLSSMGMLLSSHLYFNKNIIEYLKSNKIC